MTQVEHSSAQLDDVVERLTGADGSWAAEAHSLSTILTNRVLLDLPVLGEAAVARIGADAPLVDVRPLVRPLLDGR